MLYTWAMTKIEIQHRALELPENERLEVADALWASLSNLDALPLPAWQQDVLKQRLASRDTEEGIDWEDLKAELWPARL
ncbi:MAG: addiction module protein [Thermoanaerobaculia bacterium]|nr:addiction module protein [Thermoanaerobaculia bacterium]